MFGPRQSIESGLRKMRLSGCPSGNVRGLLLGALAIVVVGACGK
jgi:hypothetical protein